MKKLFWVFVFTLFAGLITSESANAQRHGYKQKHGRHAYNKGYHDGARAAYRYDRRHHPRHYAHSHRGYYAPRPDYPRHRRHHYIAPAPRPRAVVHVRVPLPPPPPVVVIHP